MQWNVAGSLGGTGRCLTFLLFPRPIAPHKLPHPISSLHEELPDLCRALVGAQYLALQLAACRTYDVNYCFYVYVIL